MPASDVGANYATAFIDSLKTIEELQKGSRDLETFGALLEELPSLARVLEHPGIPLERRKRILDEALEQMDVHPVSKRLLHLVVEKGRVRHIREIAADSARLRDARLNLSSAEVVTAIPIDAAGRTEWEATLARLIGRKVRVTYRTDSGLVGGALTRVGSTVYDGTIKRQLERIRGVLLGEGGE